jgi:hypothetical protein
VGRRQHPPRHQRIDDIWDRQDWEQPDKRQRDPAGDVLREHHGDDARNRAGPALAAIPRAPSRGFRQRDKIPGSGPLRPSVNGGRAGGPRQGPALSHSSHFHRRIICGTLLFMGSRLKLFCYPDNSGLVPKYQQVYIAELATRHTV